MKISSVVKLPEQKALNSLAEKIWWAGWKAGSKRQRTTPDETSENVRDLYDYFLEGDLGDEKNGGILTQFATEQEITFSNLVAYAKKNDWLFDDIDEIELIYIQEGVEALRDCYRQTVEYYQQDYIDDPSGYPEDTHALYHIQPQTTKV